MITLRTISATRRRILFMVAAIVDLGARCLSASFQYDLVWFSQAPRLVEMMSMSTATGIAVPAIAAPLVLSPIAYLLGQIFVVTEAHYVRLVSATLIVASFLCYVQTPGLSVFLAVLAYLILGSGMMRQR